MGRVGGSSWGWTRRKWQKGLGGLGLDVVRAGLVRMFLGTSLPPSQHCRIPVLDVRWALLGPWGDRARSCSPDASSSPIHSLSFPGAWLCEHGQGQVWKLFQGKSGVHGVRGHIMGVLCSPPCAWDCGQAPGDTLDMRGVQTSICVQEECWIRSVGRSIPGLSLQLVPVFADPS